MQSFSILALGLSFAAAVVALPMGPAPSSTATTKGTSVTNDNDYHGGVNVANNLLNGSVDGLANGLLGNLGIGGDKGGGHKEGVVNNLLGNLLGGGGL